MSETQERPLRRGWTTGACAAAAAKAAAVALQSGAFPDPVSIELPGGQRPVFPLALREIGAGWARAGVTKDAGDDPDVTHGALVVAEVRLGTAACGVTFRAGEGVGTVTRPGLALAVGEPAINPAPRAMIRAALESVEARDVEVTISIPGGAALAAKTMNARLGILGGLSVLGTTGVVIPYSCSSWIHSIHRGVDVALAAGAAHIAGSTGSVSERAVQRLYGLPEVALIDMGDFVGALLKYLRAHPVPRLTVAGGLGKLVKLAQGHLDLHSARSRLDSAALADDLAGLSAPAPVRDAARSAESVAEVVAMLSPELRSALAKVVAERCREVALATLAGRVAVDVAVFDREGSLVAHTGP